MVQEKITKQPKHPIQIRFWGLYQVEKNQSTGSKKKNKSSKNSFNNERCSNLDPIKLHDFNSYVATHNFKQNSERNFTWRHRLQNSASNFNWAYMSWINN